MARRPLLTEEQWARLLAPPTDEREIVRYWTLSREEIWTSFFGNAATRGASALLCSFVIFAIREGC
jgi:hypothetical protein